MPLLLNFPFLPISPVPLFLTSLLPTASAAGVAGAAQAIDTAGFWLGFTLIFIISAAESALSVIWYRIRITSDGINSSKLSYHVCGRKLFDSSIPSRGPASDIATNGIPGSFGASRSSSLRFSDQGDIPREYSSSSGSSCCGGWERRETEAYGAESVAVVDKFCCLMLVSTLLIRRFDPRTALKAPKGLVDNVKDLVRPATKRTVAHVLEHAAHLLAGLTDISLGVAGLALYPNSPQKLYGTIKDPKAPMTFENYLTLFLMYWLLGALLLLCMVPFHSANRTVQIVWWVGAIVYTVASFASLVLFSLGCWKIDYARRHHTPWTTMLSYWIGGASAIGFNFQGFGVFHVFGVVGQVFMIIHTFN